MNLATIEIPLQTKNPNNGSWGHWSAQARKRKNERARIGRHLLTVTVPKLLRVTLTRCGGREMDHAGLLAALKSVQDAVAHRLGVDDRPSGIVEWRFVQSIGGDVGVRVEIEALAVLQSEGR